MSIKPIRNDDDLRAAFARLEQIFHAPEGSPEADEMEVLVTLVQAYEDKHYPIGPADPIEAIKFRMEQQGLAAPPALARTPEITTARPLNNQRCQPSASARKLKAAPVL